MPVTRVLSPARQALKKGVVPFMKYMWEHETVVAISVVVGVTPVLAWMMTPSSYLDKIEQDVKNFPYVYPTPKRYVEGKTPPPTEV